MTVYKFQVNSAKSDVEMEAALASCDQWRFSPNMGNLAKVWQINEKDRFIELALFASGLAILPLAQAIREGLRTYDVSTYLNSSW